VTHDRQQGPTWSGGGDEALVPLGLVDDGDVAQEIDLTAAADADAARQAVNRAANDERLGRPPVEARPERPARAGRAGRAGRLGGTGGRGGLPGADDAEPAAAGGTPAARSAARRRGRGGAHAHMTAADFTAERYLRSDGEPPREGWRRALWWLTGGRVNLGPSAAELAERELIGRAKTRVAGCRSIAVISRKGGVGKTTTTLMLGHTFAALRGDRVVALDGNPDAGSLGYRVRRETAATVTNLLTDEVQITRYADIRGYTSQAPSRLEVVASDDDPRITKALGEEDYRRAIALLERHYNLICLDTGTGVLESATKGILQLADQIVVVMSPSLDSARAASSTLDWLNENGYQDLVKSAVAVVNGVRPGTPVDVARIEEHFAGRCRAVVQVPWDPHLGAGAETSPERLLSATRHAYLEVAAAVADGFTT
jgi:putative peptide zinc metalloprotease protein